MPQPTPNDGERRSVESRHELTAKEKEHAEYMHKYGMTPTEWHFATSVPGTTGVVVALRSESILQHDRAAQETNNATTETE